MRRLGALLLVSAAQIASVACGRRPAGASEVFPKAPVVLVSIDTLRSDHLPLYGYAGVETPALTALRRESILCERAYSPVPLTLPAHLSILTGLLPQEHGVHDNLGYRLAPGVQTLAELLKRAGYRTGAAVSAVVLNGTSGVSRGFDYFDDDVEPTESHQALARVQRPGAETAALLEKWIETGGDAPPFAFLHIYEPHAPYEPKEPFASRFASPYDGEIATADEVVGEFVSFLKRKGLYDPALLVVLSDHGEGLGEHGEDEHGVFLYREALQVPLLVKLPGRGGAPPPLAGATVSAPVSLTDVFGTIAKSVGLPGPAPRKDAVSIVDLAAGAAPPKRALLSETFFPRVHFGWSELSSLLERGWHYIEAPRPELFDLARDPGERTNLVDTRPDPLRSLRAELLLRRPSFQAAGPVSEEDAKKLASLGYLSSGAREKGGVLADPKDSIGTIRLLNEAVASLSAGRPEASIPVFERLLGANPDMFDVQELYSQALFDLGRFDEALAARRRMVELAPPQDTRALLSVAALCVELGRPDEARRNAELARDRGDEGAWEVLARALAAEGKLDAALAAGEKASRVGKTRRRGLLITAKIESLRGRPERALALLAEAERDAQGRPLPPLVGLHRLRGDLLARSDRLPEAEKEFAEEVRLFPRNVDARVELAVAYAAQRRLPEAERTIETLVRDVGSAEAYAKAARTLAVLGDRRGAAEMTARGRKLFPRDPRLRDN